MCFHYFESTFTLLLYISVKYTILVYGWGVLKRTQWRRQTGCWPLLAVTRRPRSPTRHDAHATNEHSQKVSTQSLRCRLLLCLIDIIRRTRKLFVYIYIYIFIRQKMIAVCNKRWRVFCGVQGPNVEAIRCHRQTDMLLWKWNCLRCITDAFLIWTAILHCRV